jgi:hypothetical protein
MKRYPPASAALSLVVHFFRLVRSPAIQLLALLFLCLPMLAQTVVEGPPPPTSGSGTTFNGGTLTSPLYLSEDPTAPVEAVTLRYLNTVLGPIQTALPNVILSTGGTMSGALVLPDGYPAASQAYVAAHAVASTPGPTGAAGPAGPTFTGGAVTSQITLPFDPTAALHAATKQYVDAAVTRWLMGGTMTSPLILSADPTTALGAATKQYVDAHVGGGGGGIATGLTGSPNITVTNVSAASVTLTGALTGTSVSAQTTNNVFTVDGFPTSGTVGGTTYSTQLDYAIATALSYGSSHSQSPVLVVGTGVYPTCTGIQMLATTQLGISIIGAGRTDDQFGGGKLSGTKIQQTCSITNPVLNSPPINIPSGTYRYNLRFENFTIDANNDAPSCWELSAIARSGIHNIGCMNATSSDHWTAFGLPNVSGFTTTDDDLDITDVYIQGQGSAYTNWALATANVVSGSIATNGYTVTSPGSQYARSTTPVYLLGHGSSATADQPCTTMPTGLHATISGGSVSSISSTSGASGCTGTVYVAVPDLAAASYGVRFYNLFDSKVNNLVISHVGQTAAVYDLGNEADKFDGIHAFEGQPFALESHGQNTFVDLYCDGMTYGCASIQGNSPTFIGTTPLWGSGSAYGGGEVEYYVAVAQGALFTNIADTPSTSAPTGYNRYWQSGYGPLLSTDIAVLNHMPLRPTILGEMDPNDSGGNYSVSQSNYVVGNQGVTGNISVGGSLSLSSDPTGALQAATKQYVDARGGGLAYTAPTVNFIPAVGSTSGAGTMVNSSFSDDTNNTYDSEPFEMQNAAYMEPEGVAISGSNQQSNPFQFVTSYWNGTAAVNTGWVTEARVGTGTTPTSEFDFYGPPGLPVDSILYGLDISALATSGTNYNTPKFTTRGSTWNGTVPINDDWSWQGVQGTGANPTSTLTFAHTGSTGLATVSMPQLVVTTGIPGIGNNGSRWTGVSSLPGTCNIGDYVTNTAATSSTTVMYVCYPANTWTALGSGGGGTSMSGTPTHTADAGAGSGPTVSFSSGATDGRGWVTLVEGTSPTTSAGIITIDFGGTYGTTPLCAIEPANASASALASTAQPFVNSASSTSSLFVITGGSTALTAGTTYIWRWACSL